MRWRTIVATVLVAYGVLVLAGIAVIYSGVYNIGADSPHWGVTSQLFETARIRSIKAHAAGIIPPAGWDAESKLPIGVEHFAAHCAVCHGAPGVPKGDIAHGLYPLPPDLALSAARYTDGELFWTIKHGIKMTGMPAWPDHSDEEIWATVAFIRKLPGMTPEAYGKLIMATMGHGGHPGQAAKPGEAPQHEHGGHQHGAHPHPEPEKTR